jgi:hypothetical protein
MLEEVITLVLQKLEVPGLENQKFRFLNCCTSETKAKPDVPFLKSGGSGFTSKNLQWSKLLLMIMRLRQGIGESLLLTI